MCEQVSRFIVRFTRENENTDCCVSLFSLLLGKYLSRNKYELPSLSLSESSLCDEVKWNCTAHVSNYARWVSIIKIKVLHSTADQDLHSWFENYCDRLFYEFISRGLDISCSISINIHVLWQIKRFHKILMQSIIFNQTHTADRIRWHSYFFASSTTTDVSS
jgi:hypothetical protein